METKLIEWLVKNKEWVFSGVGVSVAIALVGLARSPWKKRTPDSASIVVRIEGSPNRDQLDTMSGEPVPVERISSITPTEISTTIDSAPPLQRKSVAERYCGLRIEWDTELTSAEEKNGTVRLLLRAHKEEKFSRFYVSCEVNLDDYRELAILSAGTNIRVSGTIKTADTMSVDLTSAHLTVLTAKHGANPLFEPLMATQIPPPVATSNSPTLSAVR